MITGLEALIRWADPDRGLISPVDFIPVLEETGMILRVGQWAIEKALSDDQVWIGEGLAAPRVSVNVSAIQLRQRDFAETVRQIIGRCANRSGRAGGGLDLEITESLVMEDIGGNIAKLEALREMGVEIHIDDFGTGHSSLSYLARLPVDALKIDRSFIINMARSPDDTAIVSAIIPLAHALNLKVIAEGVDSEEQANLLITLNCDQMQGYLFSKPLPAAGIAIMIT